MYLCTFFFTFPVTVKHASRGFHSQLNVCYICRAGGHRAPGAENPQFPLMSEDGDRVGGQALLRDFLTFLDLKGNLSIPHERSSLLPSSGN